MVIGIYPRKSVYRDNSDSVDVQVNMCKEYAGIIFRDQTLEFRVYDRDEGFSGKNTNRPSFQALMQDVRDGLLDVVMVYKLDRISRNVKEFSAMYDTFEEHGVSFVSVKESFDTSTPIGRTVMYILAAFAQLERENTSERVGDNMLALAESGKWTGGNCPTGMTSVKKKIGAKEHSFLMVDESEIWRVRLLYELILSGYSITRIERHCRDNGIHSQSGKYLATSQIYNILTNPVYCQNAPEAYDYFLDHGCRLPDRKLFDGEHGLISYGKHKTGKEKSVSMGKENWTISVGIHKPVVSAEDWINTQSRLKVNQQVRSRKYDVGILKGVLKCNCGSKIIARTYTKNNIQFSYYYCAAMARKGRAYCNSEYVPVKVIDDLFLNELRRIRVNPDFIHLQDDVNEIFNISGIQSDLKMVNTSLDNLVRALQNNTDSPAAKYIIGQMEELDKQKAELEAQLRRAELIERNRTKAENSKQHIYEQICYLLDNFDTLSYTSKNELIRKVVKTCRLDGKTLHITF